MSVFCLPSPPVCPLACIFLVNDALLFIFIFLFQTALKTAKNSKKDAAAASTMTEEEEAMLKSGGNSNKTVKFDNLVNPKTLKAFDKKNVSAVFRSWNCCISLGGGQGLQAVVVCVLQQLTLP